MTVIGRNGGGDAVEPLVECEHADGVAAFHYFVGSGRWQWSGAALVLEPETVPGVDFFGPHVHTEDRALVAEAMSRIVDGRPVRSRYRLVADTGQTRWMVMVAHPVTDWAGTVTKSSGFVVDVTEVVQAALGSALPEIVDFRGPIEQAKGVLMAARGVTADDAFTVHRRVLRSRGQSCRVRNAVFYGRIETSPDVSRHPVPVAGPPRGARRTPCRSPQLFRRSREWSWQAFLRVASTECRAECHGLSQL